MDEILLTPRQLASLLCVHPATIYNWISRKTIAIPYIKGGRKMVRFKKSDVDKWIKKNTLKTPGITNKK